MKPDQVTIPNDKRGFTLIEVIMAIVVLSIIGAITGMGFVSAVNGYVLAKKNADTVQNAQISLARIPRELRSTDSITSGDGTSLNFVSKSLATPTIPDGLPVVLSWNSVSKELLLGADTLANNVSSFSLSYFDTYDGAAGTTYVPASTSVIKITADLIGADNVSFTFEERVFLFDLMTGLSTDEISP